MTTKSPDAIALLKADHRAVEDLFEQFEKTKSSAKQQTLAKKICTELIVHTLLEEEIFYPALQGKIEDEMLNEAYVEHDGAKLLIAQIMAGTPDDTFYEAKVMVLSEEIEHHVKEEEMAKEGMFAKARAADVDLKALGEAMQARKTALMAEIKANGLPTPIARTLQVAEIALGEPVA